MNKKNVIITIISVLILTCVFAFARTTTTDLGLVQPTWDENVDILVDINANSDILEAFANDPLEFDTNTRLEDRVNAIAQPLDAGLTDIAALAVINGNFIVGDGINWVAESGATARASIGLAIGTNVQAYDAALDNISVLAYVSPSFIKLTADDTYEVRTLDETKTDLDVDDLENLTNFLDSPCIIAGGVVSDGTNAGTFKVTAITSALLRASASATAALTPVTLAEQDNQAIAAANTDYFVIFTYGTPCTITTAEAAPNGYNAIPIGKVEKDGSNHVHYASGGYRLSDGVRKLHERAVTLRYIELAYGCTIAYSGTNNFTMAEGIIYGGINRLTQAAYDSASTTFSTIYWDGTSAWKEGNPLTGTDIAFVDGDGGNDSITQTAALFITAGYVIGDELTVSGSASNDGTYTILAVVAGTIEVATASLTTEGATETVTLTAAKYKIDFAHYDDMTGGTLADVGVAKYGVFWIYRHVGDGHVYVLYGRGTYSLAAAEAALEPTKPTHLTDFGCLIGNIIVPQAGGSFTTIQMVTDTFFTGTAVSNHANLSNLDYASAGHTGFAEETHAALHAVGAADTVFPADPNADKLLMWDDAPTGELVWTDAAAGYTNLTSFVDQTAWRVFYSNNLGDVTELALGADGTYLKSNGAEAAPTFDTPAGAGDMLAATYDVDVDGDIDVAAGGTEKSSWTLYAIPYLSGTTTFGEIAIGTAEYCLTVNATATGYDYTELAFLANIVEDTTPELGGEMDAGAHSIGFTLGTETGDSATLIDWTAGNKFKFTFGAQNETITFTDPTNPGAVQMIIVQDATGSRTITWSGMTIKWQGGTAPTLTTTANGEDIISFLWDGTSYYGMASLAFATP